MDQNFLPYIIQSQIDEDVWEVLGDESHANVRDGNVDENQFRQSRNPLHYLIKEWGRGYVIMCNFDE